MTNRKVQDLLDCVAQSFERTTGIPIEIVWSDGEIARVEFRWENKKFKFNGLIVPLITKGNLGAIQLKMRRLRKNTLLITKYVNPLMAERLKKENIFFLDGAGNGYLNIPPLFVYVKGHKIDDPKTVNVIHSYLRPAGLKIIFALLVNPSLVNEPFRVIARKGKVALGSVAKVMRELKELGFIIEKRRGSRQLHRKKALFERWVAAYPDFFRPKLLLGRFEPAENEWWKNADIVQYGASWGAEVAAWKLTGYLKPQTATIYVKEIPNQLLIDFKLKQDKNGSVEILQKFWDFSTSGDCVPAILIYADLLATGHSRDIETAQIIYEKKIAKYIG